MRGRRIGLARWIICCLLPQGADRWQPGRVGRGRRSRGAAAVRGPAWDLPGQGHPDLRRSGRRAEEGSGFVEAIMTVDLRHNVVAGFERASRPAGAAWTSTRSCRCRGSRTSSRAWWTSRIRHGTSRHAVDSRGLKRILAGFSEYGVTPIVAPELEFYLCEPDPLAPSGYRPYASQESPVYTVGDMADPKGTLSRMLDAAVDLELGAIAAAHEYGRAQLRSTCGTGGAGPGRPGVSLQGDGQGACGPRRAAGDVHGQAVQRRRGLGASPARLAAGREG